MRIVLDANQASAVQKMADTDAARLENTEVVLPPLVIAEIVLSAYPESRLRAILRCDVRFGLEYHTCLDLLGQKDAAEIRRFCPVLGTDETFHADLCGALPAPPKWLTEKAKSIKNEHADLARQIQDKARAYIRKRKPRDYQGPIDKFTFVEDATSSLADRKVGELYKDVSRRAGGSPRCCEGEFREAVLANPCLSRMLRWQIAFALGYCHAWTDDALNIDAAPERDDLTDMTIGLYVRDGDVVATEDTKFMRVVEHCEPGRVVRSAPWEECVRLAEAGRQR